MKTDVTVTKSKFHIFDIYPVLIQKTTSLQLKIKQSSTTGHVCKYQTKLCISRKLKQSFLWITSVYLNIGLLNFSHRRKPWLRKYLPHHHLQILIQGRVIYVKKISVYFLAICANFPCKKKNWIKSCRYGYFRDRILLSGQPLTYLIGK